MDAWTGRNRSFSLLRVILRAVCNHVLPKCGEKGAYKLRPFGRLYSLPGVLLFLGGVAVHSIVDNHGRRYDFGYDSGVDHLCPCH